MSDWKNQYESAAEKELAAYSRAPLTDLLDDIKRGRTGEYSTIWRTIADKGTPSEAGWALYDFLLADRPYLERYHCAGALLRILGCTEFEPVELSAGWPVVKQNLSRLREVIATVANRSSA